MRCFPKCIVSHQVQVVYSSSIFHLLIHFCLNPLLFLNILTVDGRAGSAGVAAQVQQGHAVVGFMVSAVPAHLIMQVADADLILPAKVKILFIFFRVLILSKSCASLNLLFMQRISNVFLTVLFFLMFFRQRFLTQNR